MKARKSIRAEEIEEGIRELSKLSKEEYGPSLIEVLQDKSRSEDERLKRVGRLIGVVVKRPFSKSEKIDPKTSMTGARRAWHLVEASFDDPATARTWQYQMLDLLRQETWIKGVRDLDLTSPKDLAYDAYHEQGFFWYLGTSCNKYICGNAEMKEKIKQALGKIPGGGKAAELLSVQSLLGASGTTAAAYLVSAVPWLGFAGVPVIAGVLVLIGTIGVDAFCAWTKDGLNEPHQKYRDQ